MRIPSRTRSWRCRISILSLIPGMLRCNSLVRRGPSESRHRIVPFHRPSTTDNMASIGQSDISFFDTGISPPVCLLTYLSVWLSESVLYSWAYESNDEPSEYRNDLVHWPSDRHRIRNVGLRESRPLEARRRGPVRGHPAFCTQGRYRYALLVHSESVASCLCHRRPSPSHRC